MIMISKAINLICRNNFWQQRNKFCQFSVSSIWQEITSDHMIVISLTKILI